jgi:type IV pilus assembly protein PilN
MYSIDINFLKDRTTTATSAGGGKKPGKPLPKAALLPLFIGVGIGLLFPALVAGAWGLVQWRTSQVQAEIDTKTGELQALEVKQKQIDELKTQIEIAKSQVSGLASIFGQIKSWSAVLQDIRDRVPPSVQVASIKQIEVQAAQAAPTPAAPPAEGQPPATPVAPPPITLTIAGMAEAYQPINDFILTLKNSSLLNGEETRLVKAELVDFPGTVQQKGNAQVELELPKVVQYEIQTQLGSVPDPELLRTLERKGALGLATRLRAAEGVGVAQEKVVETQPVEQTGEAQP